MSLTVACPGCSMQLALAPELLGQVVVCPQCASQFQIASGPLTDQPAAEAKTKTPAWRGDRGTLAGGFKLHDPPPDPRQQVAVPRFKPVDPSAGMVSLGQDGTLPALSLADAKQPAKVAAQADKQPQTLTLTIVVAMSLLLSIGLSLIDFSPGGGDANALDQARYQLASFYGESAGLLEPYQLLLRDAQRAHSRGDHAAERSKYREVLRLLRAENRSTSLTETRAGDEKLEAALAIVLRDE